MQRLSLINTTSQSCTVEFSFPFMCLYKLSFYVWVCCAKLSLCSYLKHSLIGFSKKSDGQLAGQEVGSGTSWEGERNSGKKEAWKDAHDCVREPRGRMGLGCVNLDS